MCDKINKYFYDYEYGHLLPSKSEWDSTCLTYDELEKYARGKTLFGWHISDLKIYDKPKELSEFHKYDFETAYSKWDDLFSIGVAGCGKVTYPPEPKEEDYVLKRPPQIWCYVEEVEG